MKDVGIVNIIGGGMAGLTTALALQTLGIRYSLFERSSEITYENVGLGISANIFPILEKWDILQETKKIGARIENFHFADKNLSYIKSFQLQSPALSVNRKSFYHLISERLNKEHVHLNTCKSVNDFSENEIVISADGINSNTRQAIYPGLTLRNSNQILWRGISEIQLDDRFKNAYHDFVGSNLRFAIIHTGQNYYSWYIIKEEKENAKATFNKTNLKMLFKDYHPIVKAVIDKSENVCFSALLDINPKERKNLNWFSNNKLMIGDAIHPSTPNMANGACLAMEDAYLLANLLNNKSQTAQENFRAFQKQRTKKVDNIVSQSWWFGKLLHQKNKTIDRFVRWGIEMTPKFLFDKIYANVLVETNVDNPGTKTNNYS